MEHTDVFPKRSSVCCEGTAALGPSCSASTTDVMTAAAPVWMRMWSMARARFGLWPFNRRTRACTGTLTGCQQGRSRCQAHRLREDRVETDAWHACMRAHQLREG